jgi:multicomponent Na+:H+ antiporter subunit F
MNVWLIAAIAMLWALVPCGIVCFRGDAANRLIGLRSSFHDIAVVMAILSFASGLVFARFLERWL